MQEYQLYFCSQKRRCVSFSKGLFDPCVARFQLCFFNFNACESLHGRRGASCVVGHRHGERNMSLGHYQSRPQSCPWLQRAEMRDPVGPWEPKYCWTAMIGSIDRTGSWSDNRALQSLYILPYTSLTNWATGTKWTEWSLDVSGMVIHLLEKVFRRALFKPSFFFQKNRNI